MHQNLSVHCCCLVFVCHNFPRKRFECFFMNRSWTFFPILWCFFWLIFLTYIVCMCYLSISINNEINEQLTLINFGSKTINGWIYFENLNSWWRWGCGFFSLKVKIYFHFIVSVEIKCDLQFANEWRIKQIEGEIFNLQFKLSEFIFQHIHLRQRWWRRRSTLVFWFKIFLMWFDYWMNKIIELRRYTFAYDWGLGGNLSDFHYDVFDVNEK